MKLFTEILQSFRLIQEVKTSHIQINKLKIFFFSIFLSIVVLITSGTDVWVYSTYNVQLYEMITNSGLYGIDSGFIGNITNPNTGIAYFTIFLKYILQTPLFFIITSILAKAFIFYLIYRISLYFLQERSSAWFATLLFIFSTSVATHGLIQNGMWGEVYFTRSSASALFTLGGVLLALNKRIILAAIIFVISTHLHPHYGVNALVYFMPAYLFSIFAMKHKFSWRIFTALFIIVINTLLLFVFNTEVTEIAEINAPIMEWYNYVYSLDPGDMSLIWTMQNYGYGLIPLIVSAVYIFLQSNIKKELEYLFIGSLSIFLIAMLFELLHYYGVFLGKISEYFIIVELRKGLWVLMFFALLLIVKYIFQNHKTLIFDKKITLLILFITTYLVPTITTVLLLLGFLLISNYKFKTLFSIFIILLFVSYEFVELRDYVNYSHEILSALFVLGCTSVALFYIWIKKYTNTKKVVFIPIIICISILTIRGVYNGNFINSYNQISVNGAFIPLTASDAAERSMLSRGGDKHDKALSQIIAQLNTDHESVLIPFDLISKYGYGGHSLLQSKLFLNRWDIAIPMLSKKSFEHLKFKCKEIFGEEKTKIFFAQKERYSKDMMYDYFDSLLFNLPIKKLKYLNIKHGVRYFVTKNEYKNYDPVYRGQKYMLYDLNSLVSTRL